VDEADEALIEKLADLFMPEVAMGLEASEDLGRKVHDGARAYCYRHYRGWTSAQVEDLARRVSTRIEWRLNERRRGSPET
jgi:hypothetical protein